MAQHLLNQLCIIAYNNSHKSNTYSIIAWHNLSAARRNLCRPPGRTFLLLGAKL